MRDQFFRLYKDIKIAERYYCRYTCSSVIWNNIITGVCLFASAVTISSWAIWKQLPLIWTVVIAASQVLSALRPLLKSSSRLSAAKYLIPEMSRLLDDLSGVWDEMNYVREYSDKEIHDAIQHYRKCYTDIREKYASSELFPEKQRIHQQAQNDAITFFSVQYDIPKELIEV